MQLLAYRHWFTSTGSTSRRDPRLIGSLTIGGLLGATGAALLAGCGGGGSSSGSIAVPTAAPPVANSGLPAGPATLSQSTRGRYLVVSVGCTDCHNRGRDDPSDPRWMAGFVPGTPGQPFQIGPFKTYPRNLTPDVRSGIGQHSERQIYNALKFGLHPDETPNVVITSTSPGKGNFPASPHYLAPPMPWPAFRHLSDDDLWSIVAYLKHGIKPVRNFVPGSEGPPDNWASSYTDRVVGPAHLPPYPSGNEQFKP